MLTHTLPLPTKHITRSSPHHCPFTQTLASFICMLHLIYVRISSSFLCLHISCRLSLHSACILCFPFFFYDGHSFFLALVFLSLSPLPLAGSVVVWVSDFSLVWLQAVYQQLPSLTPYLTFLLPLRFQFLCFWLFYIFHSIILF